MAHSPIIEQALEATRNLMKKEAANPERMRELRTHETMLQALADVIVSGKGDVPDDIGVMMMAIAMSAAVTMQHFQPEKRELMLTALTNIIRDRSQSLAKIIEKQEAADNTEFQIYTSK